MTAIKTSMSFHHLPIRTEYAYKGVEYRKTGNVSALSLTNPNSWDFVFLAKTLCEVDAHCLAAPLTYAIVRCDTWQSELDSCTILGYTRDIAQAQDLAIGLRLKCSGIIRVVRITEEEVS